ncbi:hypothetical protein Tco_0360172 [Tanacetum coccineum]
MIGRADIEGSKSNVAMNAWLPQASYPCGNFSGAPFQGTWARSVAEDASPDYNSDSKAVRFSSWAVPGSLAVTKGILNKERGFLRPPLVRASIEGTPILANHTMSTGDQYPLPTKIWFDNDPSAGSPTETLLRLLLPLNDKVRWNSRDVAADLPAVLAPRLALNVPPLMDLDCYSFQVHQTHRSPVLLFIVTTSHVSGLGNVAAPAAFLGCGSRFSGSSPESKTLILSHPFTTIVGPLSYHRKLIGQKEILI